MRSRLISKLLAAAVVAVAATAFVVSTAQARTPAPGYEQFAGCPSPEENSIDTGCIRSDITGGHFQMGTKDVPIEKPMVLSGGVDGNLENFAASPAGGLTPVKQKVPGGVIGLTGLTFLFELLGSEALTLYAVTELTGAPVIGEELEITLPIRVHLINSVLGSKCYVGSFSNPITLHLTIGTTNPPPPNKPISGVPPKVTIEEEREILNLTGGTWVDNSFAAPGANGCVLTLFGFIPISINGLVNSQSGLPAAAGTNETRQDIDISLTAREHVYP